MRKILETLRLREQLGFGNRQIARALQTGHSTVADYLRRAELAGIDYQIALALGHEELEHRLFPPKAPASVKRPQPNWAYIHTELKRKYVTLDLLWREYKQAHPDGLEYSSFCESYKKWAGKIDVSMRQHHAPADKLFVDYAGTTIDVVDGNTGEVRQAQVFVAVLGASNYTFAEATWTQGIADWVGSHVRALNFFGGSPRCVVPDNLKSGVTRAVFFEPTINETYADWARHYGIAILPARVGKPKDKAKVEGAVLIAERWIIAALRNEKFFSLTALNRTISELLASLNTRPFKKMPGSRQSAFEALDKPELLPLPSHPYEFADWQKRRVGIDYHVEVDGHYYSVPYQHAKEEVLVRIGDKTVEAYLRGKRIASHLRKHSKARHTTAPEHMPENHKAIADWTPAKFRIQAQKIGPNTLAVVEQQLNTRKYPEQAYRSCVGILRHINTHGKEALEQACELALQINSANYRSISSILKTGKAKAAVSQAQTETLLPEHHSNVRGADYYH
tara:strand:- start:883 stop:2403 length:1521 start_codon:yes stop_codon:yes gene_type:complete